MNKYYRDRTYLLNCVEVLRPPEDITVSDWCDKNRILTPQTSPEPGRYRVERTPYLRQVLDSFANPEIEHIVVCKATQLGFTEAIINMILYAIDQDPAPTLLVYPTLDLAKYNSKNRLMPAIETCEPTRQKIPNNPDKYTTLEINFSDMSLSITGANSPSELASRPVRYLFRDEIDKYPIQAGGEADPMALTIERTKNFWNRKIVDISTPTTEGGNIWKSLQSCDEIYYYYVPCPLCGHYQRLKFEQIKWDQEQDIDSIKHTAYYECKKCKGRIESIQKNQMLLAGKWIGTKGKKSPAKIGFHIEAWYSPWLSFGDCAYAFLTSKDHPEKLMNFRNSWEAQPWVTRYEAKTIEEYKSNIIDIPQFICPQKTIGLTCGIDPGQGGAWFVVLAWQDDMSVHCIHYGFIPLPTSDWSELQKLIFENQYLIDGTDTRLRIWRAGIDTGGTMIDGEISMTERAYQFIRNTGSKIYGTKGLAGQYLPQRLKISQTSGITLILIDTAIFKDAIHYRLSLSAGECGRLTFHKDTQSDIFKHILAEEKRRNKRGNPEWVKVHRDNHLLDCLVIAFALADPSLSGGIQMQAIRNEKKIKVEMIKGGWITGGGKWI